MIPLIQEISIYQGAELLVSIPEWLFWVLIIVIVIKILD